ncbi:hypothetical protein CEUSTIGMA_g11751.t1 [Chlamydomonas eustigma]|uniref:Uncharacterized protein n=1 Tax=Chlamydomonas eustigma TaxID=1157962 RepID=A0A250XN08_9CHLO|nr:hypothetical protein CEUSTIGMA_g11751.t1 [Chlamydomonas eustigma]|eukprot:GAX84329.1 hypothetical protein CEUSTIGMA_g11751.t1 [Chlamydomonas eustigma]
MIRVEDKVMESCEASIQRAEYRFASQQKPWDGYGGLLKVCEDAELREHGVIRAATPRNPLIRIKAGSRPHAQSEEGGVKPSLGGTGSGQPMGGGRPERPSRGCDLDIDSHLGSRGKAADLTAPTLISKSEAQGSAIQEHSPPAQTTAHHSASSIDTTALHAIGPTPQGGPQRLAAQPVTFNIVGLAANLEQQQQLLQLYQQYQQDLAAISSGQQQRSPALDATSFVPHVTQPAFSEQASLNPQLHSHPSWDYLTSTNSHQGSIPKQGPAWNGSVAGGMPNDAAAISAATWQQQEEELRALYNSPSVAAARREAGLPAFCHSEEIVASIASLPKPPSHR